MTKDKITALQNAVEAAEKLSAAMVEGEAQGSNYDNIEGLWQQLTLALQECYRTEALIRE